MSFTAGIAFTMYVGVGVLHVLVGLFASVGGAGAADVAGLSPTLDVDFGLLMLLVQSALLVHAALGSLMLQAIEGGSAAGAAVDVVLLLWIGEGAALLSGELFRSFFGAG